MKRSMDAIRAWLAMALLMLACACVNASPAPAGQAASAERAVVPLDHLPALRGDYFPLQSRFTGRVHHIYVRLPEGYDAARAQAYPVVYVLDGDTLFPILAPTHLFLNYDEQLPEAIVVGIAYGDFDPAINKRNIDFTGQGADTAPDQGGADRFLPFLREQLLPEVERRYHADASRRVLVGQSRGGYFVLWSAVQDPDLFWGRIASNPSPGPARELLFAKPAAHRREGLGVVVVSGARDTVERVRHAHEWVADWARRDDAPWNVQLVVLPEGTHSASIGEAYRRSMLWLFGDRRPPAAP